MSALLSTHSHQRRDTAVTVADEAAGRTGLIRQPSCPIRCKGLTLRCARGRGQGPHLRVSLWPSRVSGLHSASACIFPNRSGMLGQPPSLLSNPLPSAFASSLFPLYPSFPFSPPPSLHPGEDALRSTQSLWNSLWEKVGEVCNLIRPPRKSQAVPHSPSLLGSKCSLRNSVWGLMRPCQQFRNNAPCNNMGDHCLKTQLF